MGTLLQLAIYNPSVVNDEDFLRGFVARHREASHILKMLNEIGESGPVTHQLVLGQRGMGKSTMLRRISLGIESDPKLSERFIPLSFREEQYNVHNLDTFWQNCVDSLGDWYDRNGRTENSRELDKFIVRANGNGTSHYEFFINALAKEEKRPVLLIDNIDLVIDALPDDESWAFRRILQQSGGLVVVGAAAAYMETFSDQNRPFFDFFQITVLERLKLSDLMRCLARIAELRGDGGKNVLKLIENEPGRIRALFELTGGNPRTLTLLYVLLEADEVGDVFSDLERLLDQVTGLYKSRVEDLAPQARLVLDGLALKWNPCTAAELSVITGLATNKVSAQLDRMKGDGLIERVKRSDTKRAAFQISERFFNIWYLMRHAPRRQRMRLKWLVSFLQIFYSTQQLTDKAVTLLNEQSADNSDLLFAVGGAIGDPAWQRLIKLETKEKSPSESADKSFLNSDETPSNPTEWLEHGKILASHLERYEEAIAAFENACSDEIHIAEAKWRIGNIEQYVFTNMSKAKIQYQAALKKDPDYEFANYSLGTLLANSDDWTGSEQYLKLASKGKSTRYSALLALGGLYQYKLANPELAEKNYKKAISANKERAPAFSALGNFLLEEPNRLDEGIKSLEKARKISPEWEYPIWRLGVATFFQKRNFEHGLKLLYQAKILNPQNMSLQLDLCKALASTPQKWDEARNALQELVEGSDTLSNRELFGEFLLTALGDTEAAFEQFKMVLAGKPNNSVDYCARAFVQMYYFENIDAAKKDYEEALILNGTEPGDVRSSEQAALAIRSNLLIASTASSLRVNDIEHAYSEVIGLHTKTGRLLIDSIIELSNDNFGGSFEKFGKALELNSFELYETYKGFLIFYLRQVEAHGYGTKLLIALKEHGLSEKYWPVYSALDAFFNGEDKLFDVNPEVRGAAQRIFNWLTGLSRVRENQKKSGMNSSIEFED